MTTVLIDSHILHWWTSESNRLSPAAVEALARAYKEGGFGLERDAAQADRFTAQAGMLRKKSAGDKGGKKR